MTHVEERMLKLNPDLGDLQTFGFGKGDSMATLSSVFCSESPQVHQQASVSSLMLMAGI